MSYPIFEFRARCTSVKISQRAADDGHAMITIYVEDDGTWHEKMKTSSYWLNELIDNLTLARDHLKANAKPSSDGYGFELVPYCNACDEHVALASSKRGLCKYCQQIEDEAAEDHHLRNHVDDILRNR